MRLDIPRPSDRVEDAESGVLGVSRGSEAIPLVRTGRTVAAGVEGVASSPDGDCTESPSIVVCPRGFLRRLSNAFVPSRTKSLKV
jgi:hypothetical protein